MSSFGGNCCTFCNEGKYVCCPTVDVKSGKPVSASPRPLAQHAPHLPAQVAQHTPLPLGTSGTLLVWQTKLKLDNTAYHRANLCCGEQEGDTECGAEAQQSIILPQRNPSDTVHMVITNTSTYYPVYPQYGLDKKGKPEKGKLSILREGFIGNGEKNEGGFSDGLIQINQCNNKVMTAKVCFVHVENTPVHMKKMRLRVFDIDMGTDPKRLGPEAVQFHCPGGTFEVYGDTPPHISWTAGRPINVQEGATRNGLKKTVYKCPDNDAVTVWARMNGRMDDYAGHDFNSHDEEIELEERMIMIEFRETQCASLTFASMPPRYRQLEGGWKTSKAAEKGGNPLNGTRLLAYKNFDDLVDGPCYRDGGGRNTLVAGDHDESDVVVCEAPPPASPAAPPGLPAAPLEVIGSTTETGDAEIRGIPASAGAAGEGTDFEEPHFSSPDSAGGSMAGADSAGGSMAGPDSAGGSTGGAQVCTDIDFDGAKLTVSNLGGSQYCCDICPDDGQKLCCPAKGAEGDQTVRTPPLHLARPNAPAPLREARTCTSLPFPGSVLRSLWKSLTTSPK